MSKPRSINEINKEYNQKVATLGHLQWQLDKIPSQMDVLKQDLKSLDREADLAQKQQIREEQAKTEKALAEQRAKRKSESEETAPGVEFKQAQGEAH